MEAINWDEYNSITNSVDGAIGKLVKLDLLCSDASSNGVSVATMESLDYICKDVISEYTPIASYTTDPSQTNITHALESFAAGVNRVVNILMAGIVKGLSLLFTMISKIFHFISVRIYKDNPFTVIQESEIDSVKAAHEMAVDDTERTLNSEVSDGLLESIIGTYNTELDLNILNGTAGYTPKEALETNIALVRILSEVISDADALLDLLNESYTENLFGKELGALISDMQEIVNQSGYNDIPYSLKALVVGVQDAGGELIVKDKSLLTDVVGDGKYGWWRSKRYGKKDLRNSLSTIVNFDTMRSLSKQVSSKRITIDDLPGALLSDDLIKETKKVMSLLDTATKKKDRLIKDLEDTVSKVNQLEPNRIISSNKEDLELMVWPRKAHGRQWGQKVSAKRVEPGETIWTGKNLPGDLLRSGFIGKTLVDQVRIITMISSDYSLVTNRAMRMAVDYTNYLSAMRTELKEYNKV